MERINQPTIINAPSSPIRGKKWYQSFGIIYLILGFIIVIQLFFGIRSLLMPVPTGIPQASPPSPTESAIRLISARTTYSVSNAIPVEVSVSTANQLAAGMDLVLRFDPAVLTASSTVIKSSIFDDYPITDVNNEEGIIRISGVSFPAGEGFTGSGNLAVVVFQAKAPGTTTLRVDFEPDSTDESNIISADTNADILEKVYNLTITVQ